MFRRVLVLVSGELTRLKELLLSYNRIQRVPEELGGCESLERLELSMNWDLSELPDQVEVKTEDNQKTTVLKIKPRFRSNFMKIRLQEYERDLKIREVTH